MKNIKDFNKAKIQSMLCEIGSRYIEFISYYLNSNHIHSILEINNKYNNIDKHGRNKALSCLYVGKYPNMSRISLKSNLLL